MPTLADCLGLLASSVRNGKVQKDFDLSPEARDRMVRQVNIEQRKLMRGDKTLTELQAHKLAAHSVLDNHLSITAEDLAGLDKAPSAAPETPAVASEPAKPTLTKDQALEQVYGHAQRIGEEAAKGQPDTVKEAAVMAAYDNARKSVEGTGSFNQDFMRKSAMEAAGKEAERIGTSLDHPVDEGGAPEPATNITPADEAQATDAHAMVREAMSKLPETQRRVMEMLDSSDAEIAKELGIKPDSVKTLRNRARTSLKAALEDKVFPGTIPVEGGMKLRSRESGAVPIPQALIDLGLKARDLTETKKMTDLDRATGQWSRRYQQSFQEATETQRMIEKAVPKESRQAAVTVYMEAAGDMTKLADWAKKAKGEAFRRAAVDAQKLTPAETAIAKKARASFDMLSSRGASADVLRSHRENYVPHVWDFGSRLKGFSGRALQDRFKFAKARTFENLFEGDQAGFKPKTLSIAKLLPAYMAEMNKVIADRQFIEDISKGKAEDSRPLVIPRGKVTETAATPEKGKSYLADPRARKFKEDASGDQIEQSDYITREDQPALREWRWEGKDTEGNPIFMKDDLSLHPDTARRVEAMLGRSKIKGWYESPSKGLSVLPKKIVQALDVSQSVMKREMFSLLAPFHQVQEGTHAVGHIVNPFFGIPKIDLVGDAAQARAADLGLMLLPDRTTVSSYMEGVGSKRSFITRALRGLGKIDEDTIGKATNTVADVIDGYQDYLFHEYIPGLKFKTFEKIEARNTKRYAKELASGDFTKDDIGMLSAQQTNAAYGHLNYAMLDRSPTSQHLLQLSLLAPDFLEARSRFVGQAAKSLVGSKAGNEQLKAIAVLALAQAGAAYTISKLMGDEYDPKHPFEVIHNGRRFAMRSVPEDIFSLAKDPRQFLYGRISPLIAKGGVQSITGLNYRGEKMDFKDTAEELLAQYIPMTARAIPAIRDLTESTKQNPVSPLEQLAGSLGLRISRFSPISETYKLAGEWKAKNAPDQVDKGSYPVSKYQQLRYALEDGDLDKAQTEYQKLRDAKEPSQKIAQGFQESVNHPFTGNKANDLKFRQTLKPDQKAMYDLAVKKRRDILLRFLKIKKN